MESIHAAALFRSGPAQGGLLCFLHDLFNLTGVFGQSAGEAFELAVGVSVEDVLDAHADFFFRYVDAGLDGEDHAGLDGLGVVPRIVHVDADGMADAVDEVFAQRLGVRVFDGRDNALDGRESRAGCAVTNAVGGDIPKGK